MILGAGEEWVAELSILLPSGRSVEVGDCNTSDGAEVDLVANTCGVLSLGEEPFLLQRFGSLIGIKSLGFCSHILDFLCHYGRKWKRTLWWEKGGRGM